MPTVVVVIDLKFKAKWTAHLDVGTFQLDPKLIDVLLKARALNTVWTDARSGCELQIQRGATAGWASHKPSDIVGVWASSGSGFEQRNDHVVVIVISVAGRAPVVSIQKHFEAIVLPELRPVTETLAIVFDHDEHVQKFAVMHDRPTAPGSAAWGIGV